MSVEEQERELHALDSTRTTIEVGGVEQERAK